MSIKILAITAFIQSILITALIYQGHMNAQKQNAFVKSVTTFIDAQFKFNVAAHNSLEDAYQTNHAIVSKLKGLK